MLAKPATLVQLPHVSPLHAYLFVHVQYHTTCKCDLLRERRGGRERERGREREGGREGERERLDIL